MTEPLISWRPGWVSEWDGSVLACVKRDTPTTPPEDQRRHPCGQIYRSSAYRRSRGWVKPARDRRYPTPTAAKAIIAQVAADYRVTVAELVSRAYRHRLATARFDAMFRLRSHQRPGLPPYSLPHIGFMLGRRDHSSVQKGIRRWAEIQAKSTAKREAEAA